MNLKEIIPYPNLTVVLYCLAVCCSHFMGCSPDKKPTSEVASAHQSVEWVHLSSTKGDLPVPGPSNQQTASQVLDVDKDGVTDFIVGSRVTGPSVLWYRRDKEGKWTKYVIDSSYLRIEAGGAHHDIDNDGDLDIVFGADAGDNKIWWWENPYPEYDPEIGWKRRLIKNSGGNKHHDEMFGDFDGDNQVELVFWNQKDKSLFIAEIPENPKNTSPWGMTKIFSWEEGKEHEGLARADIDLDGVEDIVGGGRWFKYNGENFTPIVIDDEMRFTRAAAGQLSEGGHPEVVFVPGDANGPLKWYECKGDPLRSEDWVSHEVLDTAVVHGHSIGLGDVNGDGNLDIFNAEMHTPGQKDQAKMRILYGDGVGEFQESIVSVGIGNHESRMADLDGDGDLDILGKPYTWDTPRVDVWLNE